ncbi:hypothetical protein [Proteiniphilum acetatigenes]|uniref:hypothetical protein n=1 Tax=Proteiniphilum acetatigenes TaxID=294710 RepID=UPI00036A2526|nr:hypothetical protein [Proteiniphilum acetatigenes]
MGEGLNQTQVLKILLDKEKVYELAKKISEEGYFIGEEPIICIENNKKVVLEGNRRVASLKLLQNPKKYVSTAKANILLKNILKNNIPIDDYKIRCHIAPNRLLANPIIYERHKGEAVHKWRTGNQYSFIAEMYEKDGLSIDDICEVLNETRSNVLKPLKAYNLFIEGKEILEKEEGIIIDIENFDLTNLERLYGLEEARIFLGIEFDNNNGELTIKLPREEFEKRIIVTFKELFDAERFSREYNTREDLKKFVTKLTESPDIDLSITTSEEITKSRVSENRKDLENEKGKTTGRRKKTKKGFYSNFIIPRDKEIIFDNEKLDGLFSELKTLPFDKKYSFAVLLRSYLEQSLYFYLSENKLLDELSDKTSEENKKNGMKKVETVINYIKDVHKVEDDIDSDTLMNILKFNGNKEYSDISLKAMLDYVVKNKLINSLDNNTYKNVKAYIERIKMDLDLAIHNIKTIIDAEHNKRAWQHLEPLFVYLSENINTDN